MKSSIKSFAKLALIVLIAACSKNQKVVRQLDGNWDVVSVKLNGQAQSDSIFSGTSYKFNRCNVKKENCNGTFNIEAEFFGIDGIVPIPFEYSITNDGQTITFIMDLAGTGAPETIEADITEHSNSRFVFAETTTDSTGTNTLETTLERQ